VADWRWECVTDDLLDGLPPDAVRAVRQLAEELAVRESMVFLDGPGFTGSGPRIAHGTQPTVRVTAPFHAKSR